MNCSIAFSCHVAYHYDVNPVDLNEINLPDVLFQFFKNNIKTCETYDLSQKTFIFDNNLSFISIHLNIASLQAHFDDLNEFFLKFSNLPAVIFLSETRIKTDPLININIPGYTFLHYPSPTNAGGVGVYISNVITFSENQTFRLEVQGCENLWLDIEFPGYKTKYTFAVIYRHPSSNYVPFLEALVEKLQLLHNKGNRAILLGDLNFNLNSSTGPGREYLQILNANAFMNLFNKSTRVTSNSQTTIDHILTNDNNSYISPGVFHFSISDHYPIFCLFSCNKFKVPRSNGVYTF